MLTPALQADFLADAPGIFLPIHGGWGRMGMTHIRLAEAGEPTLTAAPATAYKPRVQKSASRTKTAPDKRKKSSPRSRSE